MASRPNSQGPQTGPDGRPKTQKVLEQVEEVKEIMHNNIDVMMKNHEKVSEIQGKTETMRNNASTFKKNATAVHRQMWWKNCKLQIIIALVVIAVLVVIIVPTVMKFVHN